MNQIFKFAVGIIRPSTFLKPSNIVIFFSSMSCWVGLFRRIVKFSTFPPLTCVLIPSFLTEIVKILQAIIQTIVFSFWKIVSNVKIIGITRPSFIRPVVKFVFCVCKEAQFVFHVYFKLTGFFGILQTPVLMFYFLYYSFVQFSFIEICCGFLEIKLKQINWDFFSSFDRVHFILVLVSHNRFWIFKIF